MDFEIPEELKMLKNTVRRFVRQEIWPVVDSIDPDAMTIPEEDRLRLEKKVKEELGLWGMEVPEEYGGAGLSLLALVIVQEELSQHRLGVYNPGVGAFGGNPPNILFSGTEEQKKNYLYPCIEGKRRACFALTEPAAGSDAAGIQTTAVRDGDYWVINGTKHFITGVRYADFAMVFACTDKSQRRGGISCFLVDMDTPGFTVARDIPVIRPLWPCELVFDDCRVHSSQMLGQEGEGFKLSQEWLGKSRVTYAAGCIGTAQMALDMAIEYSKQRETFGSPLASRQAIQWMLTDSAVELHATRCMVYHAAWKAELEPKVDIRQEASMIKLYATEMVGRVVDRAMQVHGALGVAKELPLERWYREVRVKRIGEGPSEIHRWVIARNLLRGFAPSNLFDI